MVKEVRIYIEGGGDGKNTKQLLRQGFSSFFKELVQVARSNKIKWNITVCGTRNHAFRDFKNALADYPNTFIINGINYLRYANQKTTCILSRRH